MHIVNVVSKNGVEFLPLIKRNEEKKMVHVYHVNVVKSFVIILPESYEAGNKSYPVRII